MAQISFLNNIKKFNSVKGKVAIGKVKREAMRELRSENYKNNVNLALKKFNKILYRNDDVLLKQFKETDVKANSKDVITIVSEVQIGDAESRMNKNLTYFLSLDDWEKYYRQNLEKLQESLGKNAHCVYATIHFDETTPHMHTMWAFSEEKEMKKEYTKEDVSMKKVKSALSTAFSRSKIRKTVEPGTKKYEEVRKKYFEDNFDKTVENQIENLNKKNAQNEQTKYFFDTDTTPISLRFFKKLHTCYRNEIENNNEIQKLKQKLEVFLGEPVEIVKGRTDKQNSGYNLEKLNKNREEKLAYLEQKITDKTATLEDVNDYRVLKIKNEIVTEKRRISPEDFLKKFSKNEIEYEMLKNKKTFGKFNIFDDMIGYFKDFYRDFETNSRTKKAIKTFIKAYSDEIKTQNFETEKNKFSMIKDEMLKDFENKIEEQMEKNRNLENKGVELQKNINQLKIQAEELEKQKKEIAKSEYKLTKTDIQKIETETKNEINKINKEFEKFEKIKNLEKQQLEDENNSLKRENETLEIGNESLKRKNELLVWKSENLKNQVKNQENELKNKALKPYQLTEAEIEKFKQNETEKKLEPIRKKINNEIAEIEKQFADYKNKMELKKLEIKKQSQPTSDEIKAYRNKELEKNKPTEKEIEAFKNKRLESIVKITSNEVEIFKTQKLEKDYKLEKWEIEQHKKEKLKAYGPSEMEIQEYKNDVLEKLRTEPKKLYNAQKNVYPLFRELIRSHSEGQVRGYLPIRSKIRIENDVIDNEIAENKIEINSEAETEFQNFHKRICDNLYYKLEKWWKELDWNIQEKLGNQEEIKVNLDLLNSKNEKIITEDPVSRTHEKTGRNFR